MRHMLYFHCKISKTVLGWQKSPQLNSASANLNNKLLLFVFRSSSMAKKKSVRTKGKTGKSSSSSRKKSRRTLSKAEEATLTIKRLAAKQKISIKLTEDQLNAITSQWNQMNPAKPAEITFVIDDKAKAGLKVASASYWGDTCCV